ncbi:hypothetical protein BGZ97_004624 [Linnemannia gamsii]|uniref:F-box domain-containing protein n=1 Tax=Linnemannia gamsii TaxID=64522 RepID=A0A9P6QVK3_9FUNG|nr:hypothetical protein BGZ97_004624 [Linnemannia gamsii]
MQLSPHNRPSNPLDLPEIRSHIARFLNCKDCLSCMRVSRDWSHDFAPYVWHTIDFAKDATAFGKVTTETLDKYGGLIAQILNIASAENLQALQHSKVDSIKSMDVRLPNNWLYRELLSDLILRCSGSVKDLIIQSASPNPNTFEEQRKWSTHFLHVNDIFTVYPPILPGQGPISNYECCLRALALWYVCITREGLSSLLRCCPSLDELTLVRVMLICHKPSLTLYTGSRLRYLSASLQQVYCNDTEDPKAPCLLLHFPLLKEWKISWMIRPTQWPTDTIPDAFSEWCPHFKTVTFATESTEIMKDLLLNSFNDLESCTLSSKNLEISTALGLLSHLDSMTSLTITDDKQDKEVTQMVFLIVKLCRNLQVLSIESIVCDVEIVEKARWACQDLRELRVRFKGLDSPRDIEGCIRQVCGQRRSGRDETYVSRSLDQGSILGRIAQFLLQFKQLKTVWLGTKNIYLPPSRTA